MIIEHISDDVATINYGESVPYPLPLLEKLLEIPVLYQQKTNLVFYPVVL